MPVDHEIAGLLELLATVDKPLHRMTPPQAREAFAGLVAGSLETHDSMARAIAHHSRAVVLSVAYRLAPEAPFPAAVEDALAATRWAAGHLAELGGEVLHP